MTAGIVTERGVEWKSSACILCECNCGILVNLGGEDGRRFEQIRGDKAHPASKGYTCQKALRLDPLRRRADGSFEEISWDTAITEVTARLASVRDTYGGESILYYGGGGQGNHLGGFYGTATMRAFGGRFRSSAIAQEKTGEAWVNGLMLGTPVRGDFEHCEVAVFVGKNPWQSHSFPHARLTLRNIAKDPARAIIVIDPRRTETAELADFHLEVRSGRDAWLLAAMGAILVEERLIDTAWLGAHASGIEDVVGALSNVPITEYCEISGVKESLVRAAARRIARASSVAVFEDFGVQMNRHSTLVSDLEKLVWLLTGNLGKPGAQYAPATFVPIVRASRNELDPATAPRSPVVGARILTGLISVQCHPRRDPHRSSQAVSRPVRGVRQSRAFARGQSADAASHSGARSRRRHRRVHDRDGAVGGLRAARPDAVREV
jgi:anaerobic selenocysteine-containing dehydrogenase